MKDKPLVSVICITYGHEDYIAQALDSFLMQKTTFPYQILVGEDKGPDRTAEIVLEYAEKYPDKIIPFIREQNMGAQRNLIDLCRRAGTPYVAFCEGDDFWIDEYKLQKQYDLMEAHPEYRACFHNTRIQTDPSWYLYGYYKKDENGDIFLPESIPGYDCSLREMRMDYYIKFGPAHTSSLFYRWDNSREIPEWYYRHIYGDHSLVMLQVGDGIIGYIPETMSVYRRSEVGVLMYGSKTEHFLRSRESWIEMACDLEKHFAEHYDSFANEEIRARIVQEFNNYIKYIVSSGKEDRLKYAYEKYSYPASLATVENDLNRRAVNTLKDLYTEDGLDWLLNDEDLQDEVREVISKKEENEKNKLRTRIASYSEFAKLPKDKSIWVFNSENRWHFGGNTRHLYEYIIAYHPEIHPVWLTKNPELIKVLKSEGLPYAKIGSGSCTRIMKKASVAIVDRFCTKAFNLRGFNKAIKVVRLGKGVYCTDPVDDPDFQEDVRFSPGATAEMVVRANSPKYDSIEITDENRGYFTENYQDTFLQIAPNKKIAEIFNKRLGIPEDSIFICGSPRSFAVADNTGDRRRKILMIPAERKGIIEQKKFSELLEGELKAISESLEQLDIYMTICLHGSYTKEYVKEIRDLADLYERITVVGPEKDIFNEMPLCAALITDHSHLMYDFAVQDKPVIIIDPEADACASEGHFLYDYESMLPGPAASDWAGGFELLKESLADPGKYREKRRQALETVCDMSVNDADNSERIIQELKKRLKFSGADE